MATLCLTESPKTEPQHSGDKSASARDIRKVSKRVPWRGRYIQIKLPSLPPGAKQVTSHGSRKPEGKELDVECQYKPLFETAYPWPSQVLKSAPIPDTSPEPIWPESSPKTLRLDTPAVLNRELKRPRMDSKTGHTSALAIRIKPAMAWPAPRPESATTPQPLQTTPTRSQSQERGHGIKLVMFGTPNSQLEGFCFSFSKSPAATTSPSLLTAEPGCGKGDMPRGRTEGARAKTVRRLRICRGLRQSYRHIGLRTKRPKLRISARHPGI